MGNQLHVYPDTLRSAATQMGTQSHAVASALSRLQSTLGSLGDVCGDDEQGHSFASGYKPKVATMEQALRNMVKGLADVEKGLNVMAANYQQADHSSKVTGGPK